MAELTSEEIIGRLKACVHDEPRLIHFAQSLGQEHLADKRDAAHQLMAKVEPLAHQIWGPQVQLVLHGSRAKGTFTDDSDFDYHIEKTGRPVTMDEMYKLKSLCNRLPGVSTIPRIKMALSISYKVEALQEGSIYVEIAPESADYIDDAATIEPLIQRAGTYFLENTSACLTVKLLKFLFQRTQPRLKACAIEQLVQEMHSKVVYKYLAGRDCGPQALLLLCCKQILEDEHQEFAAMKGTVGKIFPQGLPRIHLPSRSPGRAGKLSVNFFVGRHWTCSFVCCSRPSCQTQTQKQTHTHTHTHTQTLTYTYFALALARTLFTLPPYACTFTFASARSLSHLHVYT